MMQEVDPPLGVVECLLDIYNQLKTLPFGLSNAHATCQAVMAPALTKASSLFMALHKPDTARSLSPSINSKGCHDGPAS